MAIPPRNMHQAGTLGAFISQGPKLELGSIRRSISFGEPELLIGEARIPLVVDPAMEPGTWAFRQSTTVKEPTTLDGEAMKIVLEEMSRAAVLAAEAWAILGDLMHQRCRCTVVPEVIEDAGDIIRLSPNMVRRVNREGDSPEAGNIIPINPV